MTGQEQETRTYWTHVLDANSRHKLARIAVEIVWPLTEKARLSTPDTPSEATDG